MYKHLTGLIAPPFTPMHDDGSLNLDMIEKQAEALVESGVIGVFVCGTTGESMSLTVEERMRIAERWREVAGRDLAVIVHVGHTCLSDCKVLAEHAKKIGADAIAAMGPCFFKPETVEDLASFCLEITSAAPKTPFYYYHIPSMTGVRFAMVDFLEAAADRIPTLVGIKFTHEDLMDFSRCLRFGEGRFNMLFGRDQMLLASLVVGGRGAVGTTYNFAAPIYRRIIESYEAGDMEDAQKAQALACDMIAIIHRFGGLSVMKAMMKMIGIDCGPTRLPLARFPQNQYDKLYAELERIDLFSHIKKFQRTFR